MTKKDGHMAMGQNSNGNMMISGENFSISGNNYSVIQNNTSKQIQVIFPEGHLEDIKKLVSEKDEKGFIDKMKSLGINVASTMLLNILSQLKL